MPRYLWCPVVRCANCLITEGWVTCADESRLPHGVSDPHELIDRLRRLCASGGHTFWSDDVTLRTALDDAVMARLQGCQQITDFHLAALALQRLVAWPRSTAARSSLLAGTPLARVVVRPIDAWRCRSSPGTPTSGGERRVVILIDDGASSK